MIPDLQLTPGLWTDVYAATGIAVGTPLVITTKSAASNMTAWEGAESPGDSQEGMPLQTSRPYLLTENALGCWLCCTGARGRVNVQAAPS